MAGKAGRDWKEVKFCFWVLWHYRWWARWTSSVLPLGHKEIRMKIVKLNSKQVHSFYISHSVELAWMKLPSISKILSVYQGSVQITNPFWTFPWLNNSTKNHSTGARERAQLFFKPGCNRICCFMEQLSGQSLWGKCYQIEKYLKQFGSSFGACPWGRYHLKLKNMGPRLHEHRKKSASSYSSSLSCIWKTKLVKQRIDFVITVNSSHQ